MVVTTVLSTFEYYVAEHTDNGMSRIPERVAKDAVERLANAEARVRELEQKLERARLAMEPFGQAANDAEEFAGHDGPIGQYIQFEILRRARATLAEIGQRG